MADVLTEDGFESLDKTVGCSILITHPPVWIETSKGERLCRGGKGIVLERVSLSFFSVKCLGCGNNYNIVLEYID